MAVSDAVSVVRIPMFSPVVSQKIFTIILYDFYVQEKLGGRGKLRRANPGASARHCKTGGHVNGGKIRIKGFFRDISF